MREILVRSSVSSGCVPPCCVVQERADRILVNACLGKMRSGLLPERCVRQMVLGVLALDP
jgi:hypothetical protein